MMGGDHFTSDDMFKAVNLPAKRARIEELKKEKKQGLAWIKREGVGRKILEHLKEITALTSIELMVLLKWYGDAKHGDNKVSEGREKLRAILEEDNVAPSFKDWSVQKEAALSKLEAKPILMKETALSHLKEQQKRKLLATCHPIPVKEKQAFMEKIDRRGAQGGKTNE